MQDIDNNMDELLRKAAHNYPLNISGSNWDAVAGQLNTATVLTPKTKAKKYWLTTLLVLSLLFTADFFLNQPTKPTRKQVHVAADFSSKTNDQPKHNTNDQEVYKFTNSNKRNIIIEQKQSKLPGLSGNKDIVQASGKTEISGVYHFEKRGIESINIVTNFINVERLSGSIQITPGSMSEEVAQSSSPLSNPRKPRRNFYIGLASGPEFNQIKDQGFEKTGFDAGVIAGYQFTKKLSFESGIFFSRKYYFTEGKYFNMDMPGIKLLSLQGSCTVLEIPLKLKYGILNQNKSILFSSAGLSSYIMLKEKNNYLMQVNSTQQTMQASYDERCRYFAATIDVSIGYQHTLGTRTNLRIEPYLQLPLKGIGVGTVPVKSAGVHIGVTRSIF